MSEFHAHAAGGSHSVLLDCIVVTSNLLTSASLMPLPSDLDNIFDSEDESSDDRANAAQSGASGFAPSVPHPSSAASSGGMSMASAQAVGPVSE